MCGQYTIPWYKKFGVRRVNSFFLKHKNREFTRMTPNSLWYAPGQRGKQCEFYIRMRRSCWARCSGGPFLQLLRAKRSLKYESRRCLLMSEYAPRMRVLAVPRQP